MDQFEFCLRVGAYVEEHYGISDGGDLCYSLIDMKRIKIEDGVERAAQHVAQLIEQA